MTTYNAILKRYGCANGAACEETLGKKIAEADTKVNRYYLTVLASAALGFILLMAGKPDALAGRRCGADVVLPCDAGRRRTQPDAGGGSSRHKD